MNSIAFGLHTVAYGQKKTATNTSGNKKQRQQPTETEKDSGRRYQEPLEDTRVSCVTLSLHATPTG